MRKLIFAVLSIFVLLLALNFVQANCLTPNTLGDTQVEEIIGYGETEENNLQIFLDNRGYGIDVIEDQTQFQLWELEQEFVFLEIEFIGVGYAVNDNVFGYYVDSDPDSFVPLFMVGDHSEYPEVPVFEPGDKIVVEVAADTIGFAIDSEKYGEGQDISMSFFTENNLNYVYRDQVVVYDLDDEKYLLAFEDVFLLASDRDYEDLVVSVEVLGCSYDADLEIWDDSDEEEIYVEEEITFYADYSDAETGESIGTGVCAISFDLGEGFNLWTFMFYDVVAELFTYTTSFSEDGDFVFKVVCNDNLYEELEAEDEFTISEEEEEEEEEEEGNENHFTQYCNPNWECLGWSECVDGMMTRECYDTNYCDTEYNKPLERAGCGTQFLEKIKEDLKETNYLFWILIALAVVLVLILIVLGFKGGRN